MRCACASRGAAPEKVRVRSPIRSRIDCSTGCDFAEPSTDLHSSRPGVMQRRHSEGVSTSAPFRPHERVLARAELAALGYTRRRLTAALERGELVRLRRDRYVFGDGAADLWTASLDRAVRLGGRLTCVSLLVALSVFVFDDARFHVRVGAHASRLRERARLPRSGLCFHWADAWECGPSRGVVSLLDAVRDMLRCAQPRHAIASLDSLLHLGLVTWDSLEELFASLPARFGVLLALTDARAESGTETLVRLMLRQLGAHVDVQVQIDGVGRVDLLVDGWLVVECDSRGFHSTWAERRRDLRRDLAAAARGYTTVRPIAEDILYRPDEVLALLRGILRAPSRRPQ